MVRCAKNYVVKPPLIDVKCQFSYFTHNNWSKMKLKGPKGIPDKTIYYSQLQERKKSLYINEYRKHCTVY